MWPFIIIAAAAVFAVTLRVRMQPREPAPPPRALTVDERTQLQSLMADGEKIAAIKLHREWTGAGLAASKNAVEAL